ncbi:hypothetical protein A8C56_18385 [Niabella ginsenosidivorans]|uniref:DinB-like domain-containing protein n=1 Tax=Niabella ginsenosidivorans TaxID=1176587 RepID=A0A1A9I7K4_9BACT|nr:DinB family protein [Niabella ginsenosidivorans]ANH82681.1 hypothetical protein A8C56_18385 [Niabella ginsenosidivorans]
MEAPKLTDLIANHLFEVHFGNNWTEVNIADTLADVTWQEAVTQLSFTPNTIAEIVHHITYWNRAIARRGKRIAPHLNDRNGFDAPVISCEKEWKLLKDDNLHSAEELAAVIREFDEKKLPEPILPGCSSAYKNFQGQVEHAHYHLGQIVLLKKKIKAGV